MKTSGFSKASLEQINPDQGSSFFYRKYGEETSCETSFWHHHPEFELVYVQAGTGMVHVGNYHAPYQDGLLIFLGPNLPHYSFANQDQNRNEEVVLQITEDSLRKLFGYAPEFSHIRKLCELARQGIIFGDEIKHQFGSILVEMDHADSFQKLGLFTSLLHQLATTTAMELIEAAGPAFLLKQSDRDRLERIMNFVEAHYQEEISLEIIADFSHMTVPAFCRFFKRVTQRTFGTYLNDVRLSKACALLMNQDKTVSEIAYLSGFGNVSHFHRRFRQSFGQTPKAYQQTFSPMISSSGIHQGSRLSS